MKLNELIEDFTIFLNNEEKSLLKRMNSVMLPEQFTQRELMVIENMVRKSVVSKVIHKGKMYLVRNEKPI
jgi:hypothetical protein